MSQYFNTTPIHDIVLSSGYSCKTVVKKNKLSGQYYTENIYGKTLWYFVDGGYFSTQQFKNKNKAIEETISRKNFCKKFFDIDVDIKDNICQVKKRKIDI